MTNCSFYQQAKYRKERGKGMIKPPVRKHETRKALVHEERASQPEIRQFNLPFKDTPGISNATVNTTEGRPENEEKSTSFSDPDPRQLCLIRDREG